MAAPMDHVGKLSKTERKIYKKLNKSRALLKQDGISISDLPTKILCVSNAGLDNGVSQEEVKDLFNKHGQVSEVIMLPKKPYCFVCFSEEASAENAFKNCNGILFRTGQDSSQDIYFYASYVDQVPACVAPTNEMPPGLILLKDFITRDCEQVLLDCLNWEDGHPEGEKTLKHRRVKHYGYEFKYGINNVDPKTPLPEGIPEPCKELLGRVREMGVVNHMPDQLTVNQYEPGQGIPPHVDTPSAFEDGLMSLSLGSQVVMDFRHPDGRHLSVLLPPRSLVVMTGESRYVWSHGITPRKSDIVSSDGGLTLANRGTRTSFTFRKLTPLAGINPDDIKQWREDRPSVPVTEEAAVRLEQEHVHQVYEEIADHFSGTRHRAWPQIAEFVLSQPIGTLLADIGCGNGKYLGVNSNIYELGSDRSMNLASICRERNYPVFVGDVLSIPLRTGAFDVCLCIAVVHHLSTSERRGRALSELLRILRPGGQLLVYVWAMEQERQKTKSKYLKESKTKMAQDKSIPKMAQSNTVREDLKAGDEACASGSSVESEPNSQECKTKMVASSKGDALESETKMKGMKCETSKVGNNSSDGDKFCYESDSSKQQDKGKTLSNPVDHDDTKLHNTQEHPGNTQENARQPDMSSTSESMNLSSNNTCSEIPEKKLSVHVNRTNFKDQDLLVPWQLKNQKKASAEDISTNENTFHRFYHVFKEGELEKLCETVGGSKIVKSYYDQGNWCVILEKL